MCDLLLEVYVLLCALHMIYIMGECCDYSLSFSLQLLLYVFSFMSFKFEG